MSRLRLSPRFLAPGPPRPSALPRPAPEDSPGAECQLATHARGHARAGQTPTCLGLLIRDSGPAEGVGFQETPTKFPLPGTRRRRGARGVPVRVPVSARSCPPLTSGKKLSIVSAPAPSSQAARLQSRGSQRSARRQVQGKPRVSRRASGRLQPAEPPRCHPPVAAAPPHLLSAPRTSSVPTAAFVSSSSKFLTSGRSARGRRTAVGTFFPGWGRAVRGWRRACLPLRSAGGARSERGTAVH